MSKQHLSVYLETRQVLEMSSPLTM